MKRDTESSRSVIAVAEEPAVRDSGAATLVQPATGSSVPPRQSSAAKVAAEASASGTAIVTSSSHKRRWRLAIAAAVLIALVVGGFLYNRRPHALTEKDSILLTDFVNTIGDTVFDGTLKQALAVQLEQSPYLNLLPESRIHEALRFMGRKPDERISGDIAREICLREGVKAMLMGSIASLGNHYVITVAAVNPQTQDSLAREQIEAAGTGDNVLVRSTARIQPGPGGTSEYK